MNVATRTSVASAVLAVVISLTATGPGPAQSAAKDTRTLTTEGVTFKLPSGWTWQADAASNIAIKKEVRVGDETYTVTGELLYEAEAYLEQTITGLEQKVKESKGDLRDLKVDRSQKFGDNPAVLVSFTRVRGEDGKNISEERQWLFRRQNALYRWVEEYNRLVASTALGALASARSGVTFKGQDVARKDTARNYPEAGVKFTLPADFEWVGESKPLPTDDKSNALLFVARTVVTVKAGQSYVFCQLAAQKYPGTLDQVIEGNKQHFTEGFSEVKDFVIETKQTFKDEKAAMVRFSGLGEKSKERTTISRWFMKHKGWLLTWIEQSPPQTSPSMEAALKKARSGLSWM